ncbi:MAG: META domain-containing protein [Caldilineales bacterium]|nr:META domain-containing protein [Caldilineales bacterium]
MNTLFTPRLRLVVAVLALLSLVTAACATPLPVPSPQVPPEAPPVEPPASPEAPASETLTLFVGPNQVPCVGVAPQMCLEVKTSPDAEYTLFYDTIAGFEFEPGFEYELRVERTRRADVPADASAFTYTLVEVVSKTAVASTLALEGPIWRLLAVAYDNGQLVMPVAGTEATVTFQNGDLGGNASCNTYFGTYTADGNALTVQVGGMTMMACPEPIMAQENAFVARLQEAASYAITADQLQILNADGQVVLVFEELRPEPLVGTLWVARGYNDGQGGVVSVLADTQITALFGEDGTLSGSSGCNNYVTGYQVDGNNIAIAPAAASLRLCMEPAGIMEQEVAYLNALTAAATFEIRGDQLELRTADGALVASFVAEPAEEAAPVEEAPAAEAPSLLGTQWQWVEGVYADGTTVTVDDPTRYTLTLAEDGTAAIQADCNTGGGSYTLEGESLTFGPLRVTLMACPEGSLDSRFLEGLTNTVGYTLEGDALVLSLKDGAGTLRFRAAPAEEAPVSEAAPTETPTTEAAPAETPTAEAPVRTHRLEDIINKVWTWEGTITGAEEIVSANPQAYRITFLPGGLLRGQADCNQIRGTYKVDGAALNIQVAATTRALCPPGSQSDLFIQELNGAALFFVEGGKLFIDLIADTGTLRFTPAAASR